MATVSFVDPAAGSTKVVSRGLPTIRTLADALARLQEVGILAEYDHAKISIVHMQLRDGSVAACVAVIVS